MTKRVASIQIQAGTVRIVQPVRISIGWHLHIGFVTVAAVSASRPSPGSVDTT